MIDPYVQAIESRFPLGRGFSDTMDYGFRRAFAVETRDMGGNWMRSAVWFSKASAVNDGREKTPDEIADALWGWMEKRLTSRVRSVSNGALNA